ncbi:CDP-alcohol phosphatidyltransferase family protein, partial [Streptomyces durbertensis]
YKRQPTDPTADDPTGTLAAALERGGVAVRRPELGPLVATVPTDAASRAEALRAVDAVDEEAVRLRAAVKDHDGFFTTFFISPYSRHVARWCARRGLTPDQVTTASLVVALAGAACAATGTRPGYVAAALLLLLSFVLDCADGQLARYAVRYSRVGAWLDATFDRAKEYAFYAGLALGAARSGDDVWVLALAAMALLTVRHVMDASYHQTGHPQTAQQSDNRRTSTPPPDRAPGWTVWPRRMIVLPIGERWALIAALTAFTTPRTTFVVLLLASIPATLYTLAGRLRRSYAGARGTAHAGAALHTLTDSGPLAELLARPLRRIPRAGRLPAPAASTRPIMRVLLIRRVLRALR